MAKDGETGKGYGEWGFSVLCMGTKNAEMSEMTPSGVKRRSISKVVCGQWLTDRGKQQ